MRREKARRTLSAVDLYERLGWRMLWALLASIALYSLLRLHLAEENLGSPVAVWLGPAARWVSGVSLSLAGVSLLLAWVNLRRWESVGWSGIAFWLGAISNLRSTRYLEGRLELELLRFLGMPLLLICFLVVVFGLRKSEREAVQPPPNPDWGGGGDRSS